MSVLVSGRDNSGLFQWTLVVAVVVAGSIPIAIIAVILIALLFLARARRKRIEQALKI